MDKEVSKPEYAYIFDFDGVLVNSMPAHFASYGEALSEVGVPLIKETFYSNAGMKGTEQIKLFADLAGVKIDVEKVYARKKELWDKHTELIVPIPCNIELLKRLRAAGFSTAIATGSTPGTILPIMKEYGIEVDVVVTAEDVERGKPHPDLFLRSAGELGYEPRQCIVVEDSDVGIEAAEAAGMHAMRFFEKT